MKRWLFSDDYAIFRYLVRNDYDISLYNGRLVRGAHGDICRISIGCLPFINLEKMVDQFKVPNTDEKEHPFDEINSSFMKYITNPSDNEYVKWENYKLSYTIKKGDERILQKAESYYSYWQIYELEAIMAIRKESL